MKHLGAPTTAQEFRAVADIIRMLSDERGLMIADENRAAHYLNVIGYHRLRAYCHPFYRNSGVGKRFADGVTFNDVIKLYVLDRELRLFLMGPIEKIEIALRALLIQALGHEIVKTQIKDRKIKLADPRFYNLGNDDNIKLYHDFLRECIRMILRHRSDSDAVMTLVKDVIQKSRSKNPWVALDPRRNLNNTQHVIDNLSAWHIVHGLPFGPLSKIYSILRGDIAKQIAEPFDIPVSSLRTIFHSLSRIRNSCAHHQPIWFQQIQQMSFPKKYRAMIFPHAKDETERALSRQGVYVACAAIHILLAHISETTTWYRRLRPLVERFDQGARKRMGFPKDWEELQFWRTADVRELPLGT